MPADISGSTITARAKEMEAASTGALLVPIVLWGNRPPMHDVSVIHRIQGPFIVTGSYSGPVCVWSTADDASSV